MPRFIDLSGQKFGKLTVLERAEDYVDAKGKHRVQWKCLCECGQTKIILASHLQCGAIHSCGSCSYGSYPYRDLYEYPQNVMLDINVIPSTKEEQYKKQLEGYKEAFGLLNNREQDILLSYYKDFSTLDKLSKKYNVNSERIRQIKDKALKKLQHPTVYKMICHGIDSVQKYNEAFWDEPHPVTNNLLSKYHPFQLENIKISQRTYNLLKRNGFNDLSEVAACGVKGIHQIRGMGETTYAEIIKILNENGIPFE